MAEPIANPKAMKASQVLGRFTECQRRLEEAGLFFEAFQWPIDDADFRARLVEFWMSRGGKKEVVEVNKSVFKVIVDYGKPLKDMIAAGKYDYVNPDITEKHFPIKGSGKSEVEVELVHYNKVVTSEQVLSDFKKRGLKPAPIEVGLALGKEKPDLQREFPIVILGSAWRRWFGRRIVPCLWSRAYERGLDLDWFVDDWRELCRFLAVRES